MISKIVLKNFCAYKGCNELVFDLSKPVSLVLSGKGEGKTTIFNALLWCLYGTVPVRMSKTQLVNHTAANDIPLPENIEISVSITALINNDTITLKRAAFFSHDNGELLPLNETVHINSNQNTAEFESVVSRLFPQKLVRYFYWPENFSYLVEQQLARSATFRRVLPLANSLFNEIYFRAGRYKIAYHNRLCLHRTDREFFDECMSEDDKIVACASIYLTVCKLECAYCPELTFPLLIDNISHSMAPKHAELLLNYLLSLKNSQVIFTCSKYSAEYFHQLNVNSPAIGNRYLLERNQDDTQTTFYSF